MACSLYPTRITGSGFGCPNSRWQIRVRAPGFHLGFFPVGMRPRGSLPHAASIQAPLHDVLPGPKVKVSHPVTWTDELVTAFNECKASLSRAALLVHPHPTVPHALVTDASTNAMGAVLQQRVQDVWQPLAFSRKLSPAQQKYSAYYRELLAIYEAKVLPSYAGGPACHHPNGPQTIHLRLAPEEARVLTMQI